MLELPEQSRRTDYFRELTRTTTGGDAVSVVITHLLDDRPFFLAGLDAVAPIVCLLPKPKSVSRSAEARVRDRYRLCELSRDLFQREGKAAELIAEHVGGKPFVLLDIGGYFAPHLTSLADSFGDQFLGVVEDTENGVQKYEAVGPPPVPVFSVARSPLKNPEDHLVGQSIVFSTEALLRQRGDILPGRKAAVIGYGKLGRSIAQELRGKGVWTTVFDSDPTRVAEAFSHGFEISRHLGGALQDAGLVLCATGNISLSGRDFALLRNGAYLGTVTSSDDELDLQSLRRTYREQRLDNHVTRFATAGHYFFMLNKGNAVNFIHGAVVGSFIYLVQGEIIEAMAQLATRADLPAGIQEIDSDARRRIASIWLDHFGQDRP
jgi:adenosylhomocysteinase